MVFGSGAEEAEELTRELGAEAVAVRPAAGGRLPEGVCLIDTPDTDSMANHRHLTALSAAVAHSDVLICVFDAENPKRRDHADYLAPIVRRFDGESLVAVLNKCDRLDETELKERILPDFLDYIQGLLGWGRRSRPLRFRPPACAGTGLGPGGGPPARVRPVRRAAPARFQPA